MCLWIWPKTFICNMAKTFICACYIILCADLWCMVQAYEILLCVEHKYCYVLHKLRRVTSPFQCKGDHMQVLFESIQPNRKCDGSDPISVLQPNRRRIEPILATKQNKGWSHPQNVGWSHSNPLIPQPNRRLARRNLKIAGRRAGGRRVASTRLETDETK